MIERLRTGDIVLDGDVLPGGDLLEPDHWSLRTPEVEEPTHDVIGAEIEAIEAELLVLEQQLDENERAYDARLERTLRDDINGAMAELLLRQDGIVPPEEKLGPRIHTLRARLFMLTDHRQQLVDALAKVDNNADLSEHDKHSAIVLLEAQYQKWAEEQALNSVIKTAQ